MSHGAQRRVGVSGLWQTPKGGREEVKVRERLEDATFLALKMEEGARS